ncbi:RHS repeat-associated core domain-containing protein [Luteimonas sp. MJ204]|uniref:RHS repeat domain-containing protein n=1 Tax=Luteimonas sp. MJ145 TaxID=3129234 RepID=UPI0031BA3398
MPTYPSGHTVTSAVNALGQPTSISGGAQAYASGIKYHPNGAVAEFFYGNQITKYGSTEFLDDQYDYDGHGNVLSIFDDRTGKAGRRSRTMVYDNLDRLPKVTSQMYGSTGANYTYNVLDDLRKVTIGGAQGRSHDYCYATNRRLTSIKSGGCGGTIVTSLGYDVQGNVASRGSQGYRFDFGNRLREVDGVERYRYDGHGRRVLAMQFVQGTVLSQYGLDGKLLYQKSDRTLLQTDHVYLGGTLIASHERPASGVGGTVVKYQHTDALGSPVVVTRQDRSMVEETEYEPYGQVLNRPMHDGTGYTGHVEDAATGLVYMQQRYYDPEIGRFLSVDPVTAYSMPGSNFNRYWYGNNNPYRFIDPDGRYVCTASGKGQCARVEKAVGLIHEAANGAKEGSRIRQVSEMLGKPGDANGVVISDKLSDQRNLGEATSDGGKSIHIGPNFDKLTGGDKLASAAMHEGSHGFDHRSDPDLSSRINSRSRAALEITEHRASTSQAQMFQALGRNEPFQLFDINGGIRWDKINDQMQRSVDWACAPPNGGCGP